MKILKYIGEKIAIPIIVTILTLIIVKSYFEKPQEPIIHPQITYNTGTLITNIESPFNVNYKNDDIPFLIIFLSNSGNIGEEYIDIQIIFNNNRILKNDKMFTPRILNQKCINISSDSMSYCDQLLVLPSESSVEYKFFLEKYIKNRNDYNLSVLSSRRNWTGYSEIKISKLNLNILNTNLFAQLNSIIILNKDELPPSGIFIGGYDPLIMANGIFLLLQKKQLISSFDAGEIKKTTEKYQDGVLFGGVNLLKLNEIIINILINRDLITINQANAVINKAKNAGGVKIGDYNIIILQVEILNALLLNKKIQLIEGQTIIDISQQN